MIKCVRKKVELDAQDGLLRRALGFERSAALV